MSRPQVHKDPESLTLSNSVPIEVDGLFQTGKLKATPRKSPFLKALYRASTELKSLARAGKSFFEMIRKRDASSWRAWLQTALSLPLSSFAKRLQRDENAVADALRLPWSNGMVEGQIHRLKLIKRQMYGLRDNGTCLPLKRKPHDFCRLGWRCGRSSRVPISTASTVPV